MKIIEVKLGGKQHLLVDDEKYPLCGIKYQHQFPIVINNEWWCKNCQRVIKSRRKIK